MSEEVRLKGVVYRCVRCGTLISLDQLSMMIEIKCPNCGYRVLRKSRPPIVKHIKGE